MEKGISVIFVIPVMIAIILLARNATSRIVLYIALACIVGAALLCANDGFDTPLVAVVGFVVFGAITLILHHG